jgi:hypothetical protein
MITIECSWCETDLVLERIDAISVECPECLVTVDLAPDPEPLAIAA